MERCFGQDKIITIKRGDKPRYLEPEFIVNKQLKPCGILQRRDRKLNTIIST